MGRLITADQEVYDGEWYEDKCHGKGTYTHKNDVKYVGDWVFDKQEGHGVETWPSGDIFKGEFKNGLKNGKGNF